MVEAHPMVPSGGFSSRGFYDGGIHGGRAVIRLVGLYYRISPSSTSFLCLGIGSSHGLDLHGSSQSELAQLLNRTV